MTFYAYDAYERGEVAMAVDDIYHIFNFISYFVVRQKFTN